MLLLIAVVYLVTSAASVHDDNGRDLPTYVDHPCKRSCVSGRLQNCYYDFTLEYYFTMSKACFNCPFNKSDCSRPHCVPADGAPRGIIVANRMMPGPAIHVCQGDTIVVRVVNELASGEGTSIHWHGVHQRGSQFMDGVGMVTQCPITQKASFEYRFNASNSGTHFWHAHTGLQRVDGLNGALVIRQPPEVEVHHGLYEEDLPEHTIIVTDWLEELTVNRFAHHHHAGGDNRPRSMLINGRGRYQEFTSAAPGTVTYTPVEVFHVTQGSRYRFRTISSSMSCASQISVDNHKLTMIASDGNPFEKIIVDSFNIFPGETYDFVLDASLPVGNYWIRARGLADCTPKRANQAAILRYDGAPDTDPVGTTTWEDGKRQGRILNPRNKHGSDVDVTLTRLVNLQSREEIPTFKTVPDKKFYLPMDFYKINNYIFHDEGYYPLQNVVKNKHLYMPQISHVTNKLPTSPLLSQFGDIYPTQFCHHDSWNNKNCTEEFCECTYLLQVALGDDVELVVIDEGVTINTSHPMHLHGYNFYVVGEGKLGTSTTLDEVKRLDREGRIQRNLVHAVAKDTVAVPDGGYTILRFKADNPGFWLFHCHVQFHLDIGMSLFVQVGDFSDMPKPPKDFPRCGSWAYKGEEEDFEVQYPTRKCTDGASSLYVATITYMLAYLTHFVSV